MKKLFSLILGICLVFGVSFLFIFNQKASAAGSGENGFNEWGYNYGARLFNGWYGSYDKANPDSIPGTGDAWLVMKWSKDWTPMADEPVGAWDTNHWTWYSDDYEESSWYGFTTRDSWTDKNITPESDYMITEFLKIQKVGDNNEEWERYEDGAAVSAGWGDYASGVPKYVVYQDLISVYEKSWNIDGNWSLNFNSTLYPTDNLYSHSLIVSSNTATGASTGNTYDATIQIAGKDITIMATYLLGSGAYPYSYTAIGTITNTGTLSGEWTGSDGDSGTWSSTLGTANYSWIKLVEYNIATTSPKGLGKPIFVDIE